MIERNKYLDKLIRKKENGLIKVITGIRRCGKSYLLFNIYHDYLKSIGIDDRHIVEISLDEIQNARYRDPFALAEYIESHFFDNAMHYVFIDEIQKAVSVENPYAQGDTVTFADVLLELMKKRNADVYVTGSNSKMLSSDILTEFRGRGDEVRVNPLSYSEFYSAYKGEKSDAWAEYVTYGGMPYIMYLDEHEDKSQYLKTLFDRVYIQDILERNKLYKSDLVTDDLLDFISSAVGSLTNPTRLANTFETVRHIKISPKEISKYLDCFIDAFMITEAKRYDIKGRRYIGSPQKYYFTDIGLRNARLSFRQQEETHIMENIIFNELCMRGFDVDVGIAEQNLREGGKSKRAAYEIDFVANKGSKRYYVQSAYAIPDEEKRLQETRGFSLIHDAFRRIVIVRDNIVPWHDDVGTLYVGIEKFLLDENAIDI